MRTDCLFERTELFNLPKRDIRKALPIKHITLNRDTTVVELILRRISNTKWREPGECLD